ncbi:MAG: LPXTG cell wall anchor domain-containing protein [Anaerolineaceae bacterium]|nr:LPXTG cell wall anchor domain-containing protein [Anaerolineaceae bacterium]
METVIVTEWTLPGTSEIYEISMTYGTDAEIPEGAQLAVTALDADSPEYIAAREAIVSEKLAANPNFDETGMGMAAVDISIVAPGVGKVEPKAPVKVEINMKALPEHAEVEALKASMELQHLKNAEDGTLQVESVANTYSSYSEVGGNITVNEDNITATFNVDSFSTFSFIWTDNSLHENVIVHYVDTSGKEIQGTQRQDVTVANNAGTVSFNTYEGGITNYTFKEARIDNMTGDIVTGFTTDRNNDRLRFMNGTTNVRDVVRPYNVEVYFIYTPDDDPSGGDGTPSTLNAPKTEKTLVRQNDGTYDITLSIAGEAASVTTTTKANVIVIYDTSRSMLDTETTTTYTENENGMWGKVGDNYVQLSNQTIWKMNGEPYRDYRYKSGTGNDYQYGVYNGDVIQLYYNNGIWYRTRTGSWWSGYRYSNPYTGTRYAAVQNNNADTSYNLGFDSNTGTMVQLSHETTLVYNSGTNYNPVYTEYTGTRYTQTTTTMSKHEIAKDATSKLAAKLLGMNGKDGNPSDMVEMALIEFDSIAYRENGANITRPGAKTSNLTTFNSWVNNITIPGSGTMRGGTNWEDALDYANAYNFNDNDPVYVIFVSDGNPTFRTSANGYTDDYLGQVSAGGRNNIYTYGGGNSDPGDCCLDAAVIEARGILAANKKLYTVGAFLDSSSKMANLGGQNFDASDSDKLTQAFDDIVDSITNALNIANVHISDGITGLTANTFVSGDIDPSTFRYTKGGQPWSPITEGANRADVVFDEQGNQTVQWDMGENYMLEKNVTYTVTFTVWPKQEAYDILADLNNGIKFYTYADYVATSPDPQLSEEEAIAQGLVIDAGTRSQIIRNGNTYTVLTNTTANATYQVVTIVNGEETGRVDGSVPITNPTNGMGLSESHLDLKKEWNDSLDPTQLLKLLEDNPDYQVVLHVMNDNNEYVPVTIKPVITKDSAGHVTAATWPTEKVFIAPGVMLSKAHAQAKGINVDNYTQVTYGGTTYVVLETGHDYTIDEQNTDYHFELRADVYHPMVVDGQVCNVKFVYTGDEITGIEVIDTNNVGTIVAVNELRAGINMRKIVQDAGGNEIYPANTSYKLKVSLKDKNGNSIKFSDYAGSATSEYFKPDGTTAVAGINWDTYPIWFNIYYGANDDLDLNGTYQRSDGMVVEDGGYIFLKAGEVIRFSNVPIGTQFSFVEEDVPEGYEFVEYDYKAGKATTTWTTVTDITAGYSDTAVANQSYYLTFTNKKNAVNVELLKIEANTTTTLEGAVFDLYPESAIDENLHVKPNSTPVTGFTNLTTDANGKVTLAEVPLATYYLVETKAPDGYILLDKAIKLVVSADGVSYIQADYNSGQPQTATATTTDATITYTITVANTSGYELPNTGGSGTTLNYLGGIALLLTAAVMYGFRMRRRERRYN